VVEGHIVTILRNNAWHDPHYTPPVALPTAPPRRPRPRARPPPGQ
jgi:hypothetical protein